MNTELLAQHQARQARLARFAAAAARLNEAKISRAPDAEPIMEPPATTPPVRRTYSTRNNESGVIAPMVWRIKMAVAREFNITIAELVGARRKKEDCTPRYVAIGLTLDMTRLSLPAIGKQFGGRDHTTILNGRQRINELLQSEAFRNRYEQMKSEINL